MERYLVTPPAAEPLTLAKAKSYGRITHSYEDSDIEDNIKSARSFCEDAGRMFFLSQTWAYSYTIPKIQDGPFGFMPSRQDPDRINERIVLRGPITAIENVELFNIGEEPVELESQHYALSQDMRTFFWTKDAPEILRDYQRVRITFTGGLDTPEEFALRYPDIVEAIKMTFLNLFESKGMADSNLPPQAAQVMRKYWRPRIT